ncbi:MAG: aminomethyl-transferring glycine dehydrogenase subunit GcvPA [Desulfurococcales archaeon]|nr:aminomethyl-transferring glycine dehydrogenase subunit GcvPA [Desulfurococcales archaeon]
MAGLLGGEGHPWIPNSDPRIAGEMLSRMGLSSVDELYRDIPEAARFRGWDELPIGEGGPLSEVEVSRRLESLLERVRVYRDPPPFMGGGVWPRYVPELVRYIVERGEFLTAYTPYQAEASQGLLQALFEYQSLMAELLELEVVNSSHYDWSTALAEAVLMAYRYHRGRRRRILVPETMHPRHRAVVEAYSRPHGIVVETVRVDPETGLLDLGDLESRLGSDVAAVYVEYPYTMTGVVEENAAHIGEAAHRAGALYIMGVDPVALALLEPPGRLGADIAVGEGQPLGLGLNYGGPYLGIMAVRWDARLVRQMPGRIIGLTVDSEGRRAFAMILQTREQHIRRARATSNITTNESLAAIAAAVYLSLMGPEGLRGVAEYSWYMAHYAAKRLSEIPGVESPLLAGAFLWDFTVRLPRPAGEVRRELRRRGILAGIPLEGLTPWLGGGDILLTVTELHEKRHVDALAEAIAEALAGSRGS